MNPVDMAALNAATTEALALCRQLDGVIMGIKDLLYLAMEADR